jgi:hypothetical protein
MDLATQSDLEHVSKLVGNEWIKLAGKMKPRPFYKNEMIKFKDDADDSDYGKALRLLQE